MNRSVEFGKNRADEGQIEAHLRCCDGQFVPPLSTRVDIPEYARKIFRSAVRFEAWKGDSLVGLVAAYFSTSETQIFITNVSVDAMHLRAGIARRLVEACIGEGAQRGMRKVVLEVGAKNEAAIGFYEKIGFRTVHSAAGFVSMAAELGVGTEK